MVEIMPITHLFTPWHDTDELLNLIDQQVVFYYLIFF